MLWRPAYQTLVARDLALPASIEDVRTQFVGVRVILGGFHFQAQLQIGVWRKLMSADAGDCHWIQAYFLPDPSETDFKLLESMVPPGEFESTTIFRDEDLAWRRLIGPESVDEAFAAIVHQDTAKLIMKGLPTEEAWTAFVSEIG